MCLNARSILRKTEELTHVIHSQNTDIVMASETWLSDDVLIRHALHLGIPHFNVIRKDIIIRRGGGVAVFIKDFVPTQVRDDLNSIVYECIWIVIRPK